MPVHDWSKVPDADFHAFPLAWLGRLQDVLDTRLLPEMALFLLPHRFVRGPLEETYAVAVEGHGLLGGRQSESWKRRDRASLVSGDELHPPRTAARHSRKATEVQQIVSMSPEIECTPGADVRTTIVVEIPE